MIVLKTVYQVKNSKINQKLLKLKQTKRKTKIRLKFWSKITN